MGVIEKIGIAAMVLALIGGGVWYTVDKMQAQAAEIGKLESENQQLTVTLESRRQEIAQARTELQMWRELYDDLQQGYKEIATEREAMRRQLTDLQEQADVKKYMRCPMPDGLYQWLRQN